MTSLYEYCFPVLISLIPTKYSPSCSFLYLTTWASLNVIYSNINSTGKALFIYNNIFAGNSGTVYGYTGFSNYALDINVIYSNINVAHVLSRSILI